MNNISQDILKRLWITLPPCGLNGKFNDSIMPLFTSIRKNQEEIEVLTKQRDELLPLLMNGQATVNYHLSFGILFVYLFLYSQNIEYVWQ